MSVAVPARIARIESDTALVDLEGVRREASLLLPDDARVGDYVIVHAGFAIQRMDEEEARTMLDLLREILDVQEA